MSEFCDFFKGDCINRDHIKALEDQLLFFLEDWECCSAMGFCPDLGYLEEDWCPWCKTRRLLRLPDAVDWDEHLSQIRDNLIELQQFIRERTE